MPILFDTNVLLRLAQKQHPQSAGAVRALDSLRSKNEHLQIVHQNIVEYWAVATRPQVSNGQGLTIMQTVSALEDLRPLFYLGPELPIHSEWERLVFKYGVSGKNVHDARLVAAMVVQGIDQILTFNIQDFARYTEVSALDPVLVN